MVDLGANAIVAIAQSTMLAPLQRRNRASAPLMLMGPALQTLGGLFFKGAIAQPPSQHINGLHLEGSYYGVCNSMGPCADMRRLTGRRENQSQRQPSELRKIDVAQTLVKSDQREVGGKSAGVE
jgi:hypothetical protein